MGRVLENVSKEILRENGIATPNFFVVTNEKEAREVASELGYPVVIKALVAVGKRGKAGAVKFAESPEEAERLAKQILSMTLYNFPVEKLLVENKLDITQELYVSITFDYSKQTPVIIASSVGGVDIEEIARTQPDKVIKYYVSPSRGFYQYEAREIWSGLGLKENSLREATGMLWKLYQMFEKYNATILEVNPLAIVADGKAVAAAVLMGIDDDALSRYPELSEKVEMGSDRVWRPLTALEKEVVAVDQADPYRGTARYTEMDGDIGFLCGGGGGSLLVYDTLLRFGGKPANYTEFGGNPTDTKVYGLTKAILSKPGVKSLLVDTNITNNTQTNLVAKGIVRAVQELNIDVKKFPIVVRHPGVNEAEAKEVFAEAGIEYHTDDITMEDAARLIINKMKG